MKKYKAITLVELIIALTMVSVLLLMAFNVIYKKTKSLTMSQSGTFYCWKDWNGKLHQRLVTQTGSKVSIKPAGDGFVDECKLDLPNEVSRDVKNIRVFIIGGGAAGPKYELKDFDSTNSNIEIESEIEGDLLNSCFKPVNADKKYCTQYESSTNKLEFFPSLAFNETNNVIDNLSDKKVLLGCYITLCDFGDTSNVKCHDVYKIRNFSEIKDKLYFYRRNINLSLNDSTCTHSDYSTKGYFNFIALTNAIVNNDSRIVTKASSQEIKYNAAYKLKYNICQPKGANHFEEIRDMNFDRMKPLIITASQIGAGGKFTDSGSDINNGNGEKTTLISNVEGEGSQRRSRDGQVYDRDCSGKDTLKLKYKFSDEAVKKALKENTPIQVKSLKDYGIKTFGLNYQDTMISNYLKLANPKLPNYIPTTLKNAPNNYGDGKDYGFGLFGYSGGSNNCSFEYKPYEYINAFGGNQITSTGGVFKPQGKNCSYPGNGMGGAIIISW